MARQGDAVENLDHRAVIFPTESGITGGGEHIQRGGSERQREGQRPGSVIHQPEIFDKNIDSGFWRVIAIVTCCMRFSNIQELPAAWVTTSYIVSSGIPARAASAIASAATAMCTPASS